LTAKKIGGVKASIHLLMHQKLCVPLHSTLDTAYFIWRSIRKNLSEKTPQY